MRVRIVNLRNYKLNDSEELIRVDRYNRVLGNPFFMDNEGSRAAVCKLHRHWFNSKIESEDKGVLGELERIFWKCTQYNVALACWCAPKECHVELYLGWVAKKFREEFPSIEIEFIENSLGRCQEFEWRLPNINKLMEGE